jgi:hypothetical protein
MSFFELAGMKLLSVSFSYHQASLATLKSRDLRLVQRGVDAERMRPLALWTAVTPIIFNLAVAMAAVGSM